VKITRDWKQAAHLNSSPVSVEFKEFGTSVCLKNHAQVFWLILRGSCNFIQVLIDRHFPVVDLCLAYQGEFEWETRNGEEVSRKFCPLIPARWVCLQVLCFA